jgi:nitroreductase
MLKDLVIRNRSYRSFDRNERLTRERVLSYIDTARLTPSAINLQPIKYVPVIEELADKILPYTGWARALKMPLPPKGKGPGAFVLMCIDTKATPNAKFATYDVGIAAQTMLLSAVEDGLGGCILLSYDSEKVKKELSLADELEILLCVAIGKPDETVVLENLEKDGSTSYYRDENNVHHVPKRKLEDIIINVGASE